VAVKPDINGRKPQNARGMYRPSKGHPSTRLIARWILIVGCHGIPFFTKFSESFRLSPHLLKPSLLNICYVSASRLCLLKKPLGILIALLSSA
jgi:hypothetical protein